MSKYEIDYAKAKTIINGMDFKLVMRLPKTDKRFSFGALDGSEGENMIDLNFLSILVTAHNVNGKASLDLTYEKYDSEGQFLGTNTALY